MSYRTAGSDSSDEASGSSENAYCIFLHIAEGVGLQRARNSVSCQHDQIMMHASLNTVKFEIEGHSTETVTIFNSNCIWECDLNDLRRMKTENRPVRIACFLNNGTSKSPPLKLIGTLLLPVRGLPTITTLRNYQPKMLWHKLGALATDWRSYKPEIYLLIVVAKKSLVDDNSFSALLGKKSQHLRSPRTTETASMLQSQSNVYVQLLDQVGLIQVGNNPEVDCDIFLVVLTLRRLKDLAKLMEIASSGNVESKFVFQYELFGSATQDEISTDGSDSYTLNQKIALKFKTSVQSLRLYFQRIFYIPIIIYYNGHAIATYRFDCSKFFPDMNYFNSNKVWNKNSCFCFDRLHKILSPRATKPSVEFNFSLQLLEKYSKKVGIKEKIPLKDTLVQFPSLDEGAAGDAQNGYQTARINMKSKSSHPPPTQSYNRANSEPMMAYSPRKIEAEVLKENACVGTEDHCMDDEVDLKRSLDVCIGTEGLNVCKTIAINTENLDEKNGEEPETLTLKMVKELEAWKAQQMDEFLDKLERKEMVYLRNLEKDWLQQHGTLQQSFDAKHAECELLKLQLDKLKMQLEARKLNDVKAAKIESERSLSLKIQQLELEKQSLQVELEKTQGSSALDKQSLEVQQQEKVRLEYDNEALKTNIAHLEQKLSALGKTHFSADQLKELMNDLRQQTERFTNVERQRNVYKDKLAIATRELHQMKLGVLKQQEMNLLRNSKESNGSLDMTIGGVSREDKTNFKPKRIEIKAQTKIIKEMLFHHAESSTSFDDNASDKT